MKQLKGGGIFIVCFLGFWTAITGVFDVAIIHGVGKSLQSLTFQPVACVVVESKERLDSGGDSTTYYADIHFSYTAEGKAFTSERTFAGNQISLTSKRARELVMAYPKDLHTTAYYNPRHPSEAVLQKGFRGDEPFFLMFMMPFNIIMFGGWYGVAVVRRRAKTKPIAGGVKIIVERDLIRARFSYRTPAMLFIGVLFISSFLALFPVAFFYEFNPPLWISGLVWLTILGISGLFAWQRKRITQSGREDLIISESGRRVALPLLCGRQMPMVIATDAIADLTVEEVSRSSDPDVLSDYYPRIVRHDGTAERIGKLDDRERAEAFNSWFRNQLNLSASFLNR
ncbi:MAG: hypothetical protein JWM68_5214 [Verrucomicrobiales bacterium]|nr:hypothetical protein [Verrucomicrobiales bacterium]